MRDSRLHYSGSNHKHYSKKINQTMLVNDRVATVTKARDSNPIDPSIP